MNKFNCSFTFTNIILSTFSKIITDRELIFSAYTNISTSIRLRAIVIFLVRARKKKIV